jgi:hypothetical protein
VTDLVPAQDAAQVRQVPDERAVEQLTAGPSDPALHDRVHPWHTHGAPDGLDPDVGQDVLELGRVEDVAVTDQELDRVSQLVEVHQQITGLLGDSFARGVGGSSKDVDAPRGALDHG